MTELVQKIKCPLLKVPEVPLCDSQALDELCHYIDSNMPWSGVKTFERGSITSPGRLDLCKQGIGANGTERLVTALKDNQHIKHVLLGTDSLGDKGANILAQYLSGDESLETVYLGCNVISESGVAALSQALANNTSVKSLWLKRNPIGNAGVRSIAKMLGANTSLRTLDLVNTGIDHEGVELIAEALINGSAPVQAIYLGGNQLDEKSIDGIASLLKAPFLEALFLSVNSLGNEALKAILESASLESKIIELGLASNGIESGGLAALFEMGGGVQFKGLDLGYARSTKVLGGKANFFGDSFGENWNQWLNSQLSLGSLKLNKTGVGHITLCKIIETVKSHKSLHTLMPSRAKNPSLRKVLKASLESRAHLRHSMADDSFLYDVGQIRSVYR